MRIYKNIELISANTPVRYAVLLSIDQDVSAERKIAICYGPTCNRHFT